jgi:bacteriocin biosynthesis cyclodehydratase domain-containing protein
MHKMDAANLAFLASWHESAAPARLAHFQGLRLLIPGCGPALTSLIQAGLHCGVRQICALEMPQEEADSGLRQRIQECVAGRGAGEQIVQFLALPERDNETLLRACLRDCDAVLHLSTHPALARAQLLNRLCVAEQKMCIQAVVVGDQAWIGPLVSAEAQGCWECAWRRLQANLARCGAQPSHSALQDAPPLAESHCLSMAELTSIASRMLLALFSSGLQDGGQAAGSLSVLHLATGLSERHTFFPHPQCQACQHPEAPTDAQFLEQIHQLEHWPAIEWDSLQPLLSDAMLDARLGFFTIREDEICSQAPLAIYTATLSDPTLQRSQPDVLRVAVPRGEIEDARLLVAGDACARYAASMGDPRRLFPLSAEPSHWRPALSADQTAAICASSDQQLWTRALDLQTRQVCPVPAAHAFPALFAPDQASLPGVAWGLSWEEAMCRALLDWCTALTVEELRMACQAYARVDFASFCLPAAVLHLYHVLQKVSAQGLAVYDVTGSLRVPTFATCMGERVVAYTTACDPAQALGLGLQRALQCWQAQQCRPQVDVGAPVPDLPLALRGRQLSVPHSSLPESWLARRAWLVCRLQASAFRALALPLDHDPVLTRVLPFLVRVLVYRKEPQRGA